MRTTIAIIAASLLAVPTLAAEPAPPAAPPTTPGAGYQDGFFLQSPDALFKLKLRGLLQVRGTATVPLEETTTTSVTAAIQRAQFELGGNAFSKQLTFQLKTELGQGFTFVKDGWVNYAVAPGLFEIRVGQWKRPFSRQELTGDSKLGLVDRGLVNASFAAGRDLGVALHNDIDKSPGIEWAAGAFAGGTDKPTITGKAIQGDDGTLELDGVKLSNVPAMVTPTLVGRFGVNFGDVKGYCEADLDGGAPRGAIAASALEAFEVGDGQRGTTQVEVDGMLKLYGADLSAAMFLSSAQTGASTFEQEPGSLGLHTQAGLLVFDVLHPALRYDLVSRLDGSGEQHEIAAALAVLFFKQNVQLQADGAALLLRDVDGVHTSARVRTQLVLAF